VPIFFIVPAYLVLERFPKSGNRFSDKKRGKNKGLERFTEAEAKVKTALERFPMNISHITYAQENLADETAIEQINRRVFGAARFTRAAYLIREKSHHDPTLSLVAFDGGQLVGSVRQTRIVIGQMPALLLGPLVVHEHYKNIGIGAQLMQRAVAAAQSAEYKLILLIGDEHYYARFGFRPLLQPITLPAPADPHRILICELVPGAAQQATGRVQALGRESNN